MRSGRVRAAGMAAALLVSTPMLAAADPPATAAAPTAKAGTPDVATLLFGTPEWDKAPPGTKIRYTYEKVTSEASYGTGFKDEVVLTVGAGDELRSRTVEMQLFSGANRRPAGPFRSDQQNPILLVILENNVQELSKMFKANPRYLKNAIRKAWRDNAKIEPVSETVDGKTVRATRITVAPFVNDPEASHMIGLSGITYTVDVSDDVPGTIVAVDIRAADGGTTRLAETLRYASETLP